MLQRDNSVNQRLDGLKQKELSFFVRLKTFHDYPKQKWQKHQTCYETNTNRCGCPFNSPRGLM